MTKLERYVAKYGPAAGPKLYHALQSRSAYIGANARRRRTIRALTGDPARPARPAVEPATPLLPGLAAEAVG